ncbi:MAG: methyl-accepting chemotaxis protein [Clostridiales bacterium]|jgi:methyl-accepting chemotaxis protein|nr:methyl-accepting chemotaxis protein [Clostridiales bacterium]
MKWIRSFKIRARILVTFFVLVAFTVIIGVMSSLNMSAINSTYANALEYSMRMYETIAELGNNYSTMRIYVRNFWLYPDDLANGYTDYKNSIEQFKNSLENAELLMAQLPGADLTPFSSIDTGLTDLETAIDEIYKTVYDGHIYDAVDILQTRTTPISQQIMDNLTEVTTDMRTLVETMSRNTTDAVNQNILIFAVFTALAFVVSLILASIISASITRPISGLVKSAVDVANGELDARLGSNHKDEVAMLSNAIATIVSTVESLIAEIKETAHKMRVDGDLDAAMNLNNYRGAYRDVANEINVLQTDLVNDTLSLLDCIVAYSEGNFNKPVKQFPGKKVVANQAIDKLAGNLKDFYADVQLLASEASAGNLDAHIDERKYQNDWAKLAKSLDDLLTNCARPIKEAIQVLEAMSKGNLEVRIKGDYKGAYAVMKEATNNTLSIIANYIIEISRVLDEMSRENFNMEIASDYIGDFQPIKDSTNRIISTINTVLGDINVSAGEVASGARQISELSIGLAQGATQQSSAVEDLVQALNTITMQTRKNAVDAESADNLATSASDSAQLGNQQMKGMLTAMDEISEASLNISKIIKVIDEIAFQTNLLALNAAVEAARAGQSGKSFAVVADEVRTLAQRCKNAASETTVLIQGSVAKVTEGTAIARKTAESLESIVRQIANISELVAGVSQASNQQSESISKVSQGISQISEVAQMNTATSEESASSAQELSSQSEVFKNLVSRFRLKDNRGTAAKNTAFKAEAARPAAPPARPPAVKTAPPPVKAKPAEKKPAAKNNGANKAVVYSSYSDEGEFAKTDFGKY